MLSKNAAITTNKQLCFQTNTLFVEALPENFSVQDFISCFIKTAVTIRTSDPVNFRNTLYASFNEIAAAYSRFLNGNRQHLLNPEYIIRITNIIIDAGYQTDQTLGYRLINQCILGLTDYFFKNRRNLAPEAYFKLLAYRHELWRHLPTMHCLQDATGNLISALA